MAELPCGHEVIKDQVSVLSYGTMCRKCARVFKMGAMMKWVEVDMRDPSTQIVGGYECGGRGSGNMKGRGGNG